MSLDISLTPHLEAFVHETVTSGRYQSASEVVRAALNLLEERARQKAANLDWLEAEVQKGLDSGPSGPITPEYWQGLHSKVDKLHSGSSGGA